MLNLDSLSLYNYTYIHVHVCIIIHVYNGHVGAMFSLSNYLSVVYTNCQLLFFLHFVYGAVYIYISNKDSNSKSYCWCPEDLAINTIN